VKLSGSSIFTLGYTRDDGGRIAQKTETVNGLTSTTTYGYDTGGRLTDVATNGVPVAHYGYDDNGNRTIVQTSTGTASGTYDAQDRLTSYNRASYFYSAAGDLQKKVDGSGTTEYVYDALSNLRRVTLPSGDVMEYVVDAFNRRVGKRVNGTLVVGWIYDDQLRIVAETDGSGAVTKRFVYASRPNVPDYMIWSGSTYRIIVDNLGSPRYVVEATAGTLAQAITYDDFGFVIADTRPGFLPFGFAGGLYDPDTRLVRFGARDYDAQVGRFVSKDPTLFAGGDTNLYGYVLDDPINLIDPLGTDWVDTTANVSAGIGDALLLGYGDELRDWTDRQFGWNGGASVDRCSGAYRISTGATSAAMLAAGTLRLGYAAGAKGIALGAQSVEEAVAARNALKVAARFGLNQSARIYSTEQILSKYGTAEEAIAAAGRTNLGFNSAGAGAIAGAIGNLLNQPECGCR
jgi:RHS repeat-associated protein